MQASPRRPQSSPVANPSRVDVPRSIDELARRLRVGEPGVFGRIEHDRLLLDLRTVLPEDDERLVDAVRQAVAV